MSSWELSDCGGKTSPGHNRGKLQVFLFSYYFYNNNTDTNTITNNNENYNDIINTSKSTAARLRCRLPIKI